MRHDSKRIDNFSTENMEKKHPVTYNRKVKAIENREWQCKMLNDQP